MTTPEGIPIHGSNISDDAAMERVIDAQARLRLAQREIKALKKDRDELLEEHMDMLRSRPVPTAPPVGSIDTSGGSTTASAGDIHGMLQDAQAVNAFIEDMRSLQPDRIVLGGDIVSCDGFLAKHQVVGYVAQTEYTYREDIAAGNDILDRLQAACPNTEFVFLEGNHENRVERWAVDQTQSNMREAEFLMQAFSPRTLLRLDERGFMYVSRSEYLLDGFPAGWVKFGKMYYTHELGSGKNAARDALLKTGGNVSFFHSHRMDAAWVRLPAVGELVATNPGCLCQKQPLYGHSNPSGWTNGYNIEFTSRNEEFQLVRVSIIGGRSLASRVMEMFGSRS